jgi:hypothetical protein
VQFDGFHVVVLWGTKPCGLVGGCEHCVGTLCVHLVACVGTAMCAWLTVGCPALIVNMDAVSFQDHVALVGRWMDVAG